MEKCADQVQNKIPIKPSKPSKKLSRLRAMDTESQWAARAQSIEPRPSLTTYATSIASPKSLDALLKR